MSAYVFVSLGPSLEMVASFEDFLKITHKVSEVSSCGMMLHAFQRRAPTLTRAMEQGGKCSFPVASMLLFASGRVCHRASH